jgi:DNA-binding GntR family transcriptional regulator
MRVRIASQLRRAILAGEFKEGQSLSLTEMSKQLGISRTPIREAFQTLAAEGFIELRMNKHALVRAIGVKFIEDHYRIRRLLEGEAAFCAAENSMDVREISELTGRIDKQLPNITTEIFNDYNQRFHVAVWEAANNERLHTFLMSLWNGASKGKTISDTDHYIQSTREHMQIIGAISRHRAEDARKFMEAHVLRGLKNMLKSYQLFDTPQT